MTQNGYKLNWPSKKLQASFRAGRTKEPSQVVQVHRKSKGIIIKSDMLYRADDINFCDSEFRC